MEPSIFQYLDYRQYLRDMLNFKRSKSASFSLEMLGRKTGCLTKSHISLVLSGKRNLTSQRAAALGRALGLTDTEFRYYQRLVQFNQAKDDADREQHLAAMASDTRRRAGANLPLDSYRILENWHCLVIRELARLPTFEADPHKLAARLKGLLSASEARRALKALRDTGLLIEASGGNLTPSSEETLRSTDEINSLAVRKYHKSCLDLGKKILEVESVEEREFGSINLLLRPEDKQKLKDLIKNFREQALSLAADEGASDARVAQVNIQMFDLSR